MSLLSCLILVALVAFAFSFAWFAFVGVSAATMIPCFIVCFAWGWFAPKLFGVKP